MTRAGLNSHEAAGAAVQSTGADFTDNVEMRVWLGSERVEELSDTPDWPTEHSRPAWFQFYQGERHGHRRKWVRETERLPVTWNGEPPAPNIHVVLEPMPEEYEPTPGEFGFVLSPDFELLGSLDREPNRERRDIVRAAVSSDSRFVDVEYFGPRV